MVTSQSRLVHAVLCDDVRIEQRGKVSLMGIPALTLWVDGPLPVTLEGKQLAIWTKEPASDRFHTFNLHITGTALNGPDLLMDMSSALDYPDDNDPNTETLRFFTTIRLPSLTFDREGYIEFTVDTGRETISACKVPVAVAAG